MLTPDVPTTETMSTAAQEKMERQFLAAMQTIEVTVPVVLSGKGVRGGDLFVLAVACPGFSAKWKWERDVSTHVASCACDAVMRVSN